MYRLKVFTVFVLAVCCFSKQINAQAPAPGTVCTSPFFSEYIEPNGGYNKVLEIFNPSTNSIDLSVCQIHNFHNGSVTATVLKLTGTLASMKTYVICHNKADSVTVWPLSDTVTTWADFNGDDALMLLMGTDTVDIIGKIGEDPDPSSPVVAGWHNSDSSVKTANITLRRKSSVQIGITSNPSSFNPETQWNAFVFSDLSGIKSHVIDSCVLTQINPLIPIKPLVLFYPNPAQKQIRFNSDFINDLEINEVRIVTLEGKIVKLFTSTNNKNSDIELTNVSPGFYLLQFIGKNNIYSEKLILFE